MLRNSSSLKLLKRGQYLIARNISVGDKASIVKTFTDKDVAQFAELTGDFNPIHLDRDFAAGTIFKKPIVHGVLNLGLISAVLASKLPGPGAIIMSMDIKFTAPLYVNEEVEAEVEATGISKRKARFALICRSTKKGNISLKGEALLLLKADEK